jgi:DNA repair exonuclease SbcCD ATPase subunit
MKFAQLDITNFLTIGSARLELADRGLNVIQGVNDTDTSASSNGAGKSSIVDALCWCLFGVTARGVKGDAVVNRTAKKDAQVSVVLLNGDAEYRVVRYRKHKEHKNALHIFTGERGASFTDLSKGTDAETQKDVERLLGCSLEVFLAAIYAGQELMPDLPKMTDRELKRLIEEAAGLQRIEAAYEEARHRRTAVTGLLSNSTTRAEQIKLRLARDEAALMLKQVDADIWDGNRDERIEEAKSLLFDAKAELFGVGRTALAGKPAQLERAARLAMIDGQLANHSTLDGAARAAEKLANQAESAVDRAGVATVLRVVATIKGQIENAAAELAAPCGECGKAHTPDDLEGYVGHAKKRLADALENQRLMVEKVGKQQAAAVEARKFATDQRALVPDVSAATTARADLMLEIRGYESELKDVEVAKRRVEAAKVEVANREAAVNPFTNAVATLQGQITSDTASLAACSVETELQRNKLEVIEAVVKVFGPAGVRAQILDTVTPTLNAQTADYLSALSDGAIQATWSTLTKAAGGDLKEKFSIEVTSSTGGDSFLSLSGGEKRKVRLATALALQDLVASRATQPLSLWIGDEVDDALDPAGLERLMTILERKARERGTVLIISHNDLADWCDQVTTVTKTGGYSVVKGSLCD